METPNEVPSNDFKIDVSNLPSLKDLETVTEGEKNG